MNHEQGIPQGQRIRRQTTLTFGHIYRDHEVTEFELIGNLTQGRQAGETQGRRARETQGRRAGETQGSAEYCWGHNNSFAPPRLKGSYLKGSYRRINRGSRKTRKPLLVRRLRSSGTLLYHPAVPPYCIKPMGRSYLYRWGSQNRV
jgi:hypothetical protein